MNSKEQLWSCHCNLVVLTATLFSQFLSRGTQLTCFMHYIDFGKVIKRFPDDRDECSVRSMKRQRYKIFVLM